MYPNHPPGHHLAAPGVDVPVRGDGSCLIKAKHQPWVRGRDSGTGWATSSSTH